MAHVEIRLRRNTSTQWVSLDPVLGPGEQGYEIDTNRIKVGNGSTRWSQLEYLGSDEAAVSQADLDAHVQSETPHPVYDDGPSLLLLYQNAKV